jgi:hypothetical protein
MDRGLISGTGHNPAHRIDFADKMPLADPANRRITRHLAKIVGAESQERHARATTRRCASCLAPGVAAANDNYIKHGPPIQQQCFT